MVNAFRKCLNLKNKIGYKSRGREKIKKYCRVQFGNVILYRWLLNIGLMPNKTKKIEALKVPNQYFFSFLRGHLDGDGNIRVYQDPIYPNSQRLYIRFLSANLKHIQWIQRRIKSLLKIKGSVTASQGLFLLKFAKRDSLALLPNLYPMNNVHYLKRKYKIARSFLEK